MMVRKLRCATLVATGLSLLCGTVAVQAEMALGDLTGVEVDAGAFPPAQWSPRKEAARLTLACLACEGGMTAIDMQLSAAPAGMEGRVREGQTTARTMLDICRANAEKTGGECYGLERSDLKGAVGFVSDVRIFEGTYSATYTLYQDGSLLLMRSVAADRKTARRNGDKALRSLASQVVR